MQFKDSLDILYDIEHVNKEREYYGTVKEFEELLLLKIQKISTER